MRRSSCSIFAVVVASFVGLSSTQFTSIATFDTSYDNQDGDTGTLACGSQLAAQFPTFGSLPAFPRIGGTSLISNSPNSALCGTCWRIQPEGATSRAQEIILFAVDAAEEGWVISEEAMSELAGQEGIDDGSVSITATEVSGEFCGVF